MSDKPQSIFELHPLPWKKLKSEADNLIWVEDLNGNVIPSLVNTQINPEIENILDFVLRVVNSHEALVKIVEDCLHLMSAIGSDFPLDYFSERQDLRNRAKSALAGAKGE